MFKITPYVAISFFAAYGICHMLGLVSRDGE